MFKALLVTLPFAVLTMAYGLEFAVGALTIILVLCGLIVMARRKAKKAAEVEAD